MKRADEDRLQRLTAKKGGAAAHVAAPSLGQVALRIGARTGLGFAVS